MPDVGAPAAGGGDHELDVDRQPAGDDGVPGEVANTTQHLQRLLPSGLGRPRREGTRIHYSLSSSVVGDFWRTMRRAAEDHAEGLDQRAADLLDDRSELLRTITRHGPRTWLRGGDMVVLDGDP